VEIAPTHEFYDFAAKYTQGASEYFIPPRMSPERYRGVLAQAARAHRALGCRGATRVDLMVSESGNEFLLEVNTIPGMTPTSLLPKIALSAGIDFGRLCEMMLASASLSTWRQHQASRGSARDFADSEPLADLAGHH
jgi:D-alanine-D-alanine ligase